MHVTSPPRRLHIVAVAASDMSGDLKNCSQFWLLVSSLCLNSNTREETVKSGLGVVLGRLYAVLMRRSTPM